MVVFAVVVVVVVVVGWVEGGGDQTSRTPQFTGLQFADMISFVLM